MSGSVRRSFPRATRVFCPPDKVSVFFENSSSVNPSPFNTPIISLSHAYPF